MFRLTLRPSLRQFSRLYGLERNEAVIRHHFLPLTSLLPSKNFSMPPKRAASLKSKRKSSPAASDSEDGGSKAKKAKVTRKKEAAEQVGVAPENAQPTNKELPENIEFPVKIAGTIRIASWNVSGLAAAQKKVRFHFLSSCLPLTRIIPGI